MIKKTETRLTDTRDSFKPFHYPWAYDAWLKHEQSHWLHTEVPMAEDVKDWKNKLSKEEKQFEVVTVTGCDNSQNRSGMQLFDLNKLYHSGP